MSGIATKKIMHNDEIILYDEEGINYDDIPEITDFSKGRKNPFAGKFKDGYTIIVEHEGYDEVRKYDFSKVPRSTSGNAIPVEVAIVKKVERVSV